MLMIIVTDVVTSTVVAVQPLGAFDPIIQEFEAWCKNYTHGTENPHVYVTLWDTDTNMTHGSREVNRPRLLAKSEPTEKAVHKFIREHCAEELKANKKIDAIKKTRERFEINLRAARDHVEKVIEEG